MVKSRKYALNASNLHVGGGVQVAVSVLCELVNNEAASEVAVIVSSAVDRNLVAAGCDLNYFRDYEVRDVHGLSLNHAVLGGACKAFSDVFTFFGPLYHWRPRFRNIVGFAQPWIIYPKNECYERLPPIQKIKMRLKLWIQGQYFKRADLLIVELEHVKEGIMRELSIPAERIHVVNNCLSSIYTDESRWQKVTIQPRATSHLALGFVGRNYMHKNTEIFPKISTILKQVYGIVARFYVTFTDDEWRACSPEFRETCVNVGPLIVTQCPRFYQALDGVVFPSLLECFSATPLEAMAMERPLFASDRPFNREVCQNHAHYFDPMSPASAAAAIAKVFGGGGPEREALWRARDHAFAFSNAGERARKYLDLLSGSA